MEGKKQIYHEKQRLQFCLLHALNNLLQEKDSYTRENLDDIANKLATSDSDQESWIPSPMIFKPHYNTLTGNYDVNVLIAALEGKGKRVVWHDHRKTASSIKLNESDESLDGIVLNVLVRRFGGLWQSRHWVTLKVINGVWYNLDSDLTSPKPFKHVIELEKFLDTIISQSGEQLPPISQDDFLYESHKISMKLENNLNLLGELGDAMVGMLPNDLAFTVFVPSTKAFEHELKLFSPDSLSKQKVNDTYITLTRILGFAAIPQQLPAASISTSKEIVLDSISGFPLYISKIGYKSLLVNNIKSAHLDIRKGEIIVHIMNGVIMNAEFEVSIRNYD